eukprot:3427534-Prymnesium_polylepis.2
MRRHLYNDGAQQPNGSASSSALGVQEAPRVRRIQRISCVLIIVHTPRCTCSVLKVGRGLPRGREGGAPVIPQ